MQSLFEARDDVQRLRKIFGHPPKPRQVTQKQFDNWQDDLDALAVCEWHEVDAETLIAYLYDMQYVRLQPDLFEHVFPAVLLAWPSEMTTKEPTAFLDEFYRALLLSTEMPKLLGASRLAALHEWMVVTYLQTLEVWHSEHAEQLRAFHALGQSVPIVEPILNRLLQAETLAQARWWLDLASGVAWDENACPFIPPWTPDEGGGGVYVTDSDAAIYGAGYLPSNLDAMGRILRYETFVDLLHRAATRLDATLQADWIRSAIAVLEADRSRTVSRLARLTQLLAMPDLGGVRKNPLASSR